MANGAIETYSTLPKWSRLMKAWVERGLGTTGITLPFLAGALALDRGDTTVSLDDLESLLEMMISMPVPNHFVGVRWCGNIDAPVLSLLPLNSPLSRKCELHALNGKLSFAFSPDAISSFGGLDCNEGADCVEKLIRYALPYVIAGNFSRVRGQAGEFTYSTFLPREIEFVNDVMC